MKIVRATTAGFCMGVDLALKQLDTVIENNPDATVYTLGPIIHNPQVLAAYARRGVQVVDSPEEVPLGGIVVIRAHGIPRSTQSALAKQGNQMHDATCPKVKKAQILIGRKTAEGRKLLLYGEDHHPEVKGLLSYAEHGALLFEDVEELRGFEVSPQERYCMASQTTQDKEMFRRAEEYVRKEVDADMITLNTICDATKDRQSEAAAIAREVDVMVVVGGRESGNTRRLAKVVEDMGVNSLHVESADELDCSQFEGITRVGLTAGASTPKTLIDDVEDLLHSCG